MPQAPTRDAHHQRALELLEQKQYALALVEIEASIKIQETSEKWNDWGVLQLFLGQVEKSQDGLNRALRLDPLNTEAAENLSAFLKLTGPAAKFEQAVNKWFAAFQRVPFCDPALPEEFRRALTVNQADSEYKVRVCYKLLQQLPSGALPLMLEKLANISSQDYLSGLVLALHKLDAHDFDGAIKLLWTAWQLNPNDLFTERLLIHAVHEHHRENPAVPDTFAGLEEFLATHFCDRAWRHLEFGTTGEIYACCPAHVPFTLGNVQTHSVAKVRQSPVLHAIRESILDGSYRYCSKLNCPLLVGRKLPSRDSLLQSISETTEATTTAANPAESTRQKLERQFPIHSSSYPSKLVLSYDRSCNLACPSCRTDFYMAGSKDRSDMDSRFEDYILEAASNAHLIFLNGAGEIFSSRHSRQILHLLSRERYPQLKIRLITNATLLDRRAWQTFDLAGRTEGIWISIDAALPETYKVTRRGGDFARLMANLEFLSNLRENEGETFRLEFHFVVSSMNFTDMPEFVRMAKRFKADRVLFSLIRRWGHLSPEEMKHLAVHEPAHPQHQQFLDTLRAPEMLDPVVFQGSLGIVSRP